MAAGSGTAQGANHHLRGAFGQDTFGRWAEAFARWFGTPGFIVGQSLFVVGWITLNVVGAIHHWDAYPFILLNLAFSTQAAYAAPLILLAQTRQADRDHRSEVERERMEDAFRDHVQAESEHTRALIAQNTEITERIDRLTNEVHAALVRTTPPRTRRRAD